jgi:hypothetical protein
MDGLPPRALHHAGVRQTPRGISTRRLEASCSTKKLCAIVATEVAIDPSRR